MRAIDMRRQRSAMLGMLVNDYATALARRQKMRGHGMPTPVYVTSDIAQVRLAIGTPPEGATGASALHYAFDAWMLRNHPGIPFERYADDAILTPEELARLWHAAEGLRERVWCDRARFLIGVPCRRAEAASMEWLHLDLGPAEWRQPSHMTKNCEPHRLHLHLLALEVLRARHAAAGRPTTGLVFPAPRSGRAVISFHKLKLALSGKASVGTTSAGPSRPLLARPA